MKKLLTHLAFSAIAFAGVGSALAAESVSDKMIKLVERMAGDVDANKPDCDKIATALHKHADEDAKLVKELKAAEEKMTKEQKAAMKKEMETKYGERLKAAMLKMAPLKECKSNAKIQDYRKKTGM